MQSFFQFNLVEEKLKQSFHNRDLVLQAFTHRSFWNENQDLVAGYNERLEFLGDSVLGLLVSNYLFQNYPDFDEGTLSKIRSQLVDAPACAGYIQKLEISELLLLGKGEMLNEGKGRESIMADLFEAVIGALYLDQGIDVATDFFFSHFGEDVEAQIASPQRNWKAELQDWAQKNFQTTPTYEVLEESGPAHQKQFRVAVFMDAKQIGEGVGFSKKEAQINAAQNAFRTI